MKAEPQFPGAMRTRCLLEVMIAVGAGVCASQAQLPLLLEPAYDTYVRSDEPDTNYGSEGNLFVHSGTNLKRTYLQFDLGSIPLGSIREASLRLGFAEGARTGTAIDLHHVADDTWNEFSLTWRSAPPPDLPAVGTATAEFGKVELTWNLPVSIFATDPDGRLSLLLKLADEGLSDTATFYSKESVLPLAHPPQLLLSVPEPPGAVLASGLGLAALAAHRRCRRERTFA